MHDLIRAGNLYLSQADALALAIENNLDVELDRFSFQIADSDVLRAKGGGLLRGVPFIVTESPTGVGGPLSPVVTNPASSTSVTTGSTVSTNAIELGALGEPQTNLSIQGTIPQSKGTTVPIFDPSLAGQLSWLHQTTPQTDILSYGVPALVSSGFVANAGLVQAFSSGAQVNLSFDNSHQSLNALDTNYNPFTGSSLGLNVTQPLLRGFGPALNRRFIRIANNDRKITTLLFQQQLIATVYGIIRLYTDFVALYEDVKVKQENLNAAEKLYSDTKAQVDEGTLAPVEMTRANAQVFSTRQDLINAARRTRGTAGDSEEPAYPERQCGPGGTSCHDYSHRLAQHPRKGGDPAHTGSVRGSLGEPAGPESGRPADREFSDWSEGFPERCVAGGGPRRDSAE